MESVDPLTRARRVLYVTLVFAIIALMILFRIDDRFENLFLYPSYLLLFLVIASGDFDLGWTPRLGHENPLVKNSAVSIVSLFAALMPFLFKEPQLHAAYLQVGFALAIVSVMLLQSFYSGIYVRAWRKARTAGISGAQLFTYPIVILIISMLILPVALPLLGCSYISTFYRSDPCFVRFDLPLAIAGITLSVSLFLIGLLLTDPAVVSSITVGHKGSIHVSFAHECLSSRLDQFFRTVTFRLAIDFLVLGFIFLGLYLYLGTIGASLIFLLLLLSNSWFSHKRNAEASRT